jgi:hypothetical protein
MSLSRHIIDKVVQGGSFFKDDFDGESQKINATTEIRSWFLKELGITVQDSHFIDFYTLVATPPIGKRINLLPLDEIMENGYNYPSCIIIGDDEMGTLIYNKAHDTVMEYSNRFQSEPTADELNQFSHKWNSFKEFLEDYYNH